MWKPSLIVAATLVFSTVSPALADANKALVGKWKAVAVEDRGERRPVDPGQQWTLAFRKGSKMVATIVNKGKKQTKRGEWKVDGDKLVTRFADRVEVSAFRVKGDRLRLTKTAGKNKQRYLHLKRVGR